jgi:dolichol-phosphate mannosyltransferase
MKTVTVVVPCFNEEAVLPELFRRLTRAADGWPYRWNVIAVDDGSSDATLAMLRRQHERDPRWCAISLSRNFGQQAAISAGLAHATGDAVLIMDADLQDPPEEAGRLLAKWEEGYEVVFAVRTSRKEGRVRKLCYWAFYRVMARLVPFEIPLDCGDFSVLDRRVVEILNAMPERRRFVRGLRAWSGFRQTGIAYDRDARHAGAPKYNFRSLLRLAKDGVFSFSGVPLRLASHLGFWISVLSLAGVLFTLIQRVFRSWFAEIGLAPVPGFATIVISILFLGGVQLLALGIIGEYLERIFEEVKGRPAFIVAGSVGIEVPGAKPAVARAAEGGRP